MLAFTLNHYRIRRSLSLTYWLWNLSGVRPHHNPMNGNSIVYFRCDRKFRPMFVSYVYNFVQFLFVWFSYRFKAIFGHHDFVFFVVEIKCVEFPPYDSELDFG